MKYILLLTVLLGISLTGCKKQWNCTWLNNTIQIAKNGDTTGFTYTGKQSYFDSVKQQYIEQGYEVVYERSSINPSNPPTLTDCGMVKAYEKNGAVCQQE